MNVNSIGIVSRLITPEPIGKPDQLLSPSVSGRFVLLEPIRLGSNPEPVLQFSEHGRGTDWESLTFAALGLSGLITIGICLL